MATKYSCLAVIPARGGSKRIPRKNIRSFGGKPMLFYSIQAALRSELFANVVVSTDDEEVACLAEMLGAEVPFLRDKKLADDFTPVSKVTADALRQLDPKGDQYFYVCQLMPNCPLRTADDVKESFSQIVASNAIAQISVSRFGWQTPWWAMKMCEGFFLEPLFQKDAWRRSQDLESLFCPTGAVWWAQSASLIKHENFYMPGVTGWEIPWQRAMDIDTEEDWKMAEFLLEYSLENF